MYQPGIDALEERQLMTASLQPISQVAVPALQGTTVPLLANSGATDPQNFTVTSSNPDIVASVAQGPFWTLGVSFSDATTPTDSFTGSLTFQLFQNLTPNTVNMIEEFTNDGFYVNSGDHFPRIVSDFDSPLTTVIQGGSTNVNGTGSSGQPNTPFVNENVQQLALTGSDQLALANSGGTDSNDTQFFINTGAADVLGYNYTVFGQLVSGQYTVEEINAIPVQTNPVTSEDSQPASPLTITSASVSNTSPDGVVMLDTTQARPGETSTITVTATDPTDGTTASQSFNVAVGEYAGPTTESAIGNVNFKPYANPVTASAFENASTPVQLSGQNTYPDTSVKIPLTYNLVSQPGHGTVSDFDASTGTLIYTPDPGYQGTDTFQYDVTANGPKTTAPPATSSPATVSVGVSATPPLVSVQNVALTKNSRGMVTQIDVTFSNQVSTAQADNTRLYRLGYGHGKATSAGGAGAVRLLSASYSTATETVTLAPRRPFALKGRALQLSINGTSPSGLQDVAGRYIDGAKTGQAGSDAVVSITRNGPAID
jgi:cyclophilin family peptidyl-prolyl cis-trans isomerase